jgi:hypothetical protein
LGLSVSSLSLTSFSSGPRKKSSPSLGSSNTRKDALQVSTNLFFLLILHVILRFLSHSSVFFHSYSISKEVLPTFSSPASISHLVRNSRIVCYSWSRGLHFVPVVAFQKFALGWAGPASPPPVMASMRHQFILVLRHTYSEEGVDITVL